MKILYFHGLKGSSKSNTSLWIKSQYKDTIYVPDIDYTDPKIYDADYSDFDLIIGNSMGGFLANYYANKYQLPQVLINPCRLPQKEYNKHDHVFSLKHPYGAVVFLGDNDELFGDTWEDFRKDFNDYCKILSIAATHRIGISNYDLIKSEIDNLISTFLME